MNDNEYLKNQKLIFTNLLEATLHEYAVTPKKNRGDITIGASATVFSIRTSTGGILAGEIARAVLPEIDGSSPERAISVLYPLESLMRADVFELFSFHGKECTFLKYEGGERKDLHIYPDTAQDGLLIHLEWKEGSGAVSVLREEDVIEALKAILPQSFEGNRLTRKPEVWFNGNLVSY